MKISTKLSVSSAILAAVLTAGCSQQQVGGSQVSGYGQMGSQAQIESNSQMSSQTQIQKAPVIAMPSYQKQPVYVTRSVRRSGIGLPPAKPGQCFAKVKTPSKYVTKSRKVLVRKSLSKRVLVRGPQYGWNTKRVLVRKAAYKTRSLPAQYTTKTQKVLVKPAHYIWSKKARSRVVRIDNMTGEILCRIRVPAKYKTITKRVQVRPARVARTLVPAVYKTVKTKKLLSPAQYKTVSSPALYKTQNYRVKVGSSRIVWRQVMCKTHKSYKKHYAKARYQKPVRQYHKPTYRKPAKHVQRTAYRKPVKQYRKATYRKPVKQYRKVAPRRVVHKVIHKHTTKYRKPAISHREYYSVMNAGKKVARKAAPRSTKKSTISQREYNTVMKMGKKAATKTATKNGAAKKSSAKKATAKKTSSRSKSTGISQRDYYSVMNAGKKAKVKKASSKKRSTAKKHVKHSSSKKTMKQTKKHVEQNAKAAATKATNKATAKPSAPVAKKATNADAQKQMSKQNIIRSIQKALKAKGFDPGTVDGKMGAGTAAALKAFQSSHGLPVGRLTKDTFRALGLIR